MRIAQMAPLFERVPPPAYGGTELVVSLLTDELVRQGHDVTLFATGDSITLAKLESVYPRPLRADGIQDVHAYNLANTIACYERADEFDIIHNHTHFNGFMMDAMLMANLIRTPVLTTVHLVITPDEATIWPMYKGFYNVISVAAKKVLPESIPEEGYVGVVHHGLDYHTFPFVPEFGDYLLSLSRISPEKGIHTAIEVAKKLKKRLVIAGKVDEKDRLYFESAIEPHVDGDKVIFLGEADAKLKRELYSQAECLLMPLEWHEPFGLVMIESMACGTPVIAYEMGSAPEIIVNGKTGFIVNTFEELLYATKNIRSIDRAVCRQHIAMNFSVEKMAKLYVEAYRRILSSKPMKVERNLSTSTSNIEEVHFDVIPAQELPSFQAKETNG